MQGGACNAQLTGGLALVVTGTAQGFAYGPALQLIQGQARQGAHGSGRGFFGGGGFSNGGGQLAAGDQVAVTKDDGTLHSVFQLPHVAGPGIAQQAVHGLRREAADALAIAPGETLQKMGRQHRDVLASVPQGGAPPD